MNNNWLFCYYLRLEKDVALHLNKLESPLPKHAFCQVGWNWPSGSGEEDFLNTFNIILDFRFYLPLKKDVTLHLKKLESPLVPSLVEIGPPKNLKWFSSTQIYIAPSFAKSAKILRMNNMKYLQKTMLHVTSTTSNMQTLN